MYYKKSNCVTECKESRFLSKTLRVKQGSAFSSGQCDNSNTSLANFLEQKPSRRIRVRSSQIQKIKNIIQDKNKCLSNSAISYDIFCKDSNIEEIRYDRFTGLVKSNDSVNNLNKSRRFSIPYLNLKLTLLSARKDNNEIEVKSAKPKSQAQVVLCVKYRK